jgi:hypothetical protein
MSFVDGEYNHTQLYHVVLLYENPPKLDKLAQLVQIFCLVWSIALEAL